MITIYIYFFFISTGLKVVLGQYELFTDRNTADHLVYTIGNGDPMHGVCTLRMRAVRMKQEEETDESNARE